MGEGKLVPNIPAKKAVICAIPHREKKISTKKEMRQWLQKHYIPFADDMLADHTGRGFESHSRHG
jgi:hypothetical protein